jgi:hypothetical protein
MREKSLLHLFLVLNGALAGAFVVYLFVANRHQPDVVATNFPKPTTNRGMSLLLGSMASSNALLTSFAAVAASTNLLATNALATSESASNPPAPKAIFVQRKFTWQDVEAEEYRSYLDSLRAVGCPEDKVRSIALADINELFDKKRIKEAVAHDIQWWRGEPELMLANALQEKGRHLEEERRALIGRLLGQEVAEAERSETMLWNAVQLTGPVLGALPVQQHNEVQEICARSMERHQAAFWARANEGQPLNQVEMAKLREHTRSDLRKVLNEQGMEEFLLRYSHNANRLRQELRGFDPTPEEFRKIFHGIDPIEHQMQLEYGGPEALSEAQRERFERQRDTAIRAALTPQRYQAYLLTKDPLYRQAQMTAMQYGAPTDAIMPIYQMTKANEAKRQKIMKDASLSPQQKTEALNAVSLDQQRSVQRIVSEMGKRR